MGLRKQLNQIVPENEKLSVNDFIVKAARVDIAPIPGSEFFVERETLTCGTDRSTSGLPCRWKVDC